MTRIDEARRLSSDTYATHWKQATRQPSGIIPRLRATARHAALSASSAMNRSLGDKFLRCMYCHYVFDDQRGEFERQILQLQEIGSFVDTDTCIRMIKGEQEIDGRYYHLSFDDGFRNNFTNAFPILEEHDVPAIFFVPSAVIGASYEEARTFSLEVTHHEQAIEIMTWEDLATIASSSCDVGSHTRTHARFSKISHDPSLLEDEIAGSKQEIEAKLGMTCKYISWPYGQLTDADTQSLTVVADAGYEACFGAFRGTVQPKQTDLLRIPRHHFEVQWPLSHVGYFARGNREVAG